MWLWKNGAVSAASTSDGELNSSTGKSPAGTDAKLPKPPSGVGRTTETAVARQCSDSATGVSLTLTGAAILKPRGLPSRRGEKPGICELNAMPVVPPALKWQALQFLWPGSPMLPVSRNSVLPVLASALFSTRDLRSKSSCRPSAS